MDIRKIEYRPFDKPTVTLGSFDGLHRGHQAILKRMIEKSKERRRTGVVVTYEPHPQSVVAPGDAPLLLTTLEEKVKLLEKLGVEETVVMNFDQDLKNSSPEDFIKDILVDKLNVGELVVGNDHAFGRNRSGGIGLLKQAGLQYDFDLEVVPALFLNEVRISSSHIRKMMKSGEFIEVIAMLGHPYPLTGQVIPGKGRGKSLDYPTINLKIEPRKLLPADGVYSARVQLEDKSYVGMLYIGPRPTFGEEDRSVEIHVFDLERDVIGSKAEAWVENWVREPKSFSDARQLKEQIKSDEKVIKHMLQSDLS
ncbi:MAG TPA: bifunctional riboflavin kinase/FAD synthetase [candidate division Zixibacteria bacterium]